MSTQARLELINILDAVQVLLRKPANVFGSSSWADVDDAMAEIESMSAQIREGSTDALEDAADLFAPSGPIHEVALESGWEKTYLDLAEQADELLEDLGVEL